MNDEEQNREALEYCDRTIDERPDDGISWLLKANCHYRLGELDMAAEAYGRAAELGELGSQARFLQGSCLVELGRIEEAEAPLRHQLELTPDHLDALFLLGLSLRVLSRRDESDVLLSRVQDLNPAFYEGMFARYAEYLAEGVESPMLRDALRSAAGSLRRGPA